MLVMISSSLNMFIVSSGSQFLRYKRSQFEGETTQTSLRPPVLFTDTLLEVCTALVGATRVSRMGEHKACDPRGCFSEADRHWVLSVCRVHKALPCVISSEPHNHPAALWDGSLLFTTAQRKVRHRADKQLDQAHTANKWWCRIWHRDVWLQKQHS